MRFRAMSGRVRPFDRVVPKHTPAVRQLNGAVQPDAGDLGFDGRWDQPGDRPAGSCAGGASNFSRVSIVPKILPQTSFDACILRAILSVQSCGTWQSGQLARTPERFEKCTVRCNSCQTLSCIS